MWGFQRHGIIPDAVTMGKPMGNGHPIGCLAARHDLMDAFSQRSRYFNTFGGNTVSCAVGLAVLNVIAEEKLQDNARIVGAQLREGLKSLATQHDLLGEVRGTGLYYGVDVNTGRFQSPGEAAGAVVNHLRENGVLIGATGKDGTALKIRPPLVFSKENCDFFLDKLGQTLRAVR
jgi:4-aminobutyrate aminotransferase-like enzyme